MELPWTRYWLVQAAEAEARAEALTDLSRRQALMIAAARLNVPIEQPEAGWRD